MPLPRTALSVTILGLLLACSSSTAPKPTVAGTWHVSLGALTSGTLSPASFDVVVPNSGTAVTMPGLTWSVGSVLFDSLPSIPTFSDTTTFGFDELERNPPRACQGVVIQGTLNAAKDTLSSVLVAVTDTITISGVHYCGSHVTGSGTVHK